MTNQYNLNQGLTECDIGDMRVSFVDANDLREQYQNVPHFHSVFELQYVKCGKMQLKNNITSLSVEKGEFALLPPNYFHRTEIEYNTGRYALLLSLSPIPEHDGGFSEYEYYTSLWDSVDDVLIGDSPDVKYVLSRISDIYMGAGYEHKLKIYFSMLFIALSEWIEQSLPQERSLKRKSGRGRSSRAALRGLIDDYISLNYAEDGIIGNISNILHMSRRNTSRVIAELFGVSLSELVIRQRMNCALGFITESDMPLSEISQKVGYNTYSAFYKAFVKYFGVSPDSYRV